MVNKLLFASDTLKSLYYHGCCTDFRFQTCFDCSTFSSMGHSTLNLKLHVTICHETFLFVLFLKEYKKWWRLKQNFRNCLNASSYCDVKFWPLEGDFSPLFRKLVAKWILGHLNAWKLVPEFFRSGNPFLKSKNPKNESFDENPSWKKFHAHILAANMGLLVNDCKNIFLPMLQYTAYILPKW